MGQTFAQGRIRIEFDIDKNITNFNYGCTCSSTEYPTQGENKDTVIKVELKDTLEQIMQKIIDAS